MSTPNESAVPILPSTDLDRSAAFYGYLGFRTLAVAADYLRAVRGEIEIHLYAADGTDPLANSAGCYLRVADPQQLRSRWHTDGVACLDVPAPDTYGPTTFAVVDPDGNTLRIGPVPDRALTVAPAGTKGAGHHR